MYHQNFTLLSVHTYIFIIIQCFHCCLITRYYLKLYIFSKKFHFHYSNLQFQAGKIFDFQIDFFYDYLL